MIITISGLPGAGKTTAAIQVAEKLGYKHYSVGDLRGKMAIERGMTLDDLNKLGEKEAFTDKEADDYQAELGKKEDNFIIDGRLSFHFIPHSTKIFLIVDEKQGAERIFKEQREDEPDYNNVDEVLKANKERMESDRKRYKKYYDIDPFDKKHYDLIVDTTDSTQEITVKKILDFIEEK